MSVFTNPTSGAKQQAEEYVRAVLDLLGGADPFAVLSETPRFLERTVTDMTPAELTKPEAPYKWSIASVIHHLSDSELVFGYRIRRVLVDDRPTLRGYDQDAWADRLGYERRPVQEGLSLFSAIRRSNLALLQRAADEDLRRLALHQERGEEPLAHMLRLYAGHDLVHRRQIERIRSAVAA